MSKPTQEELEQRIARALHIIETGKNFVMSRVRQVLTGQPKGKDRVPMIQLELVALTELEVMREFVGPRSHCSLCGNWGFIDTRGQVHTPAGFECGDLVFCVCPNGRALKKGNASLEKLVARQRGAA